MADIQMYRNRLCYTHARFHNMLTLPPSVPMSRSGTPKHTYNSVYKEITCSGSLELVDFPLTLNVVNVLQELLTWSAQTWNRFRHRRMQESKLPYDASQELNASLSPALNARAGKTIKGCGIIVKNAKALLSPVRQRPRRAL